MYNRNSDGSLNDWKFIYMYVCMYVKHSHKISNSEITRSSRGSSSQTAVQ